MNFKEYLDIMISQDASDLYLTAAAKATIRVNGELQPIEAEPLPPGFVKTLALQIMNDQQRAQFEKSPEMNLSFVTDKSRFRVNVFVQKNEVGMVVRSIKIDIPEMEAIGLPAKVLQKIIMLKRGLILFVGATSSGKSTSLASMIHYRNCNSAGHIITIEDPMEFVHQHRMSIVNQREVGFDTDSYQNALENTLRQAPDVILIGEIRSRETMEHAVTFAETGHLCLSTLHANNANQAFTRILSFFPPDRHQRILLELSLNVRAIISQRLIPCIQGGRVPAVEILLDSPLIKELIKRGEFREIKDVMKKSTLMGMQTFDQALLKLYKEDKISYEDALANADSANDLRLAIQLDEDIGDDDSEGETEAGSELATSTDEKPTTPEISSEDNPPEIRAINKIRERVSGLSLEKNQEDVNAEKEKGLIRRR